ncbi:MAG: hypothetical protein KC656_12205 [Myxococcales bacterium]|nr:hypothetical protein [Myxococcales bacterium]
MSVWTRDPWRRQQIRSALALAVWDELHDHSIVIAFPQLDVHLDQKVVERLGEPERRPA